MEKTTKRVDQLETRVSELDDAEYAQQKTARDVKTRIQDLGEQMDYMDSKSRQNNLCIYNVLQEKSEGSNMTAFLQKLIAETLNVAGELNIIRAHRIHGKPNSKRPIIVAFLNFDTKKRVLKAAWDMKEVWYKGARIYFDHDFTFKTRQQRALYRPIRECLKAQDIKTHILAPAKLKVFNEDGTSATYSNPAEATRDLEQRGLYKASGEGHRSPAGPQQQTRGKNNGSV